eukprot:TRINITY_DN22193_c0_g1_i2.p1 TRINITY_DN22193_c0_g1~~TRINITY_DN22193_c0_g1_i2.p1  ORF type:complete len:890 (-),score=194.71 TRINITY_DN22193_c0_g1_i2:567-3236(-)
MSGNETVKVIVRCRPMNKREDGLKCKNVVTCDGAAYICSISNPHEPNSPPKSFTFDGVYGIDSTTEAIYNDNGFDLVEGVLEGYNGTVFAYGQTGCGKSFSMQGIQDPASQRGIIPRSFEHIFEAIDASENMKYLVHASYLEIYNEDVHDLLGEDIKKKLDLKEHPDKGVYVHNISLHAVSNTAECEALMLKGWGNRATGATKMNADSSRSHSIFTINIEMLDTGATGNEHIRKGKLNLVDLAGSERQSKTEASGDRLKEATKINLSLSALGNVISALVDGKSKHIPYRDSKLTRLLQDSLGGNTKTMMVACLSPADNNYEETISTLRYANRAKNIKNKPKINEDPKDAMLREYQSEIEKLKSMLEKAPGGTEFVPNEEILEAERQRVRSEYEQEMKEMREKYKSEQQSKAKIQAEVEEMKRQYEEKLQEVNDRAKTATERSPRTSVTMENGEVVESEEVNKNNEQNEEQKAAMEKLRKLQASLLDGGKGAGNNDLKEKRLRKKKAAEKRLKVLGEALGHVDDEDGVLVKVYDDIQTELQEKTAALKRMKQRVRGLNSEINDLQSEFERDRTDYLDTIRKQDQQILLIDQILEKVQPTLRKDCNYSNIEKIKADAVWSDETQRWKVPELVVQKTKLPPAERPFGGTTLFTEPEQSRVEPVQQLSRTAPGRLEAFGNDSDDEHTNLKKKLAKSEQEDVVGNYFKPQRASRLMAQAQETQRAVSEDVGVEPITISPSTPDMSQSRSGGSLLAASQSGISPPNTNLASSFNSGLNTVGLNNGYQNGGGGGGGSKFSGARTWGPSSTGSSWLENGSSSGGSYSGSSPSYGGSGGGYGGGGYKNSNSGLFNSSSYASDLASVRKPTRLEALPSMDRAHPVKKKSMPMLNTMGTF